MIQKLLKLSDCHVNNGGDIYVCLNEKMRWLEGEEEEGETTRKEMNKIIIK